MVSTTGSSTTLLAATEASVASQLQTPADEVNPASDRFIGSATTLLCLHVRFGPHSMLRDLLQHPEVPSGGTAVELLKQLIYASDAHIIK